MTVTVTSISQFHLNDCGGIRTPLLPGSPVPGTQQRQADFPVIVKVRVEPDRPGPRRPELHLQQQQAQHFGLEGGGQTLGGTLG